MNIEIDVFDNERDAQVKAEKHRRLGHRAVITKTNRIMVYDNLEESDILQYEQNGMPLYLVEARW